MHSWIISSITHESVVQLIQKPGLSFLLHPTPFFCISTKEDSNHVRKDLVGLIELQLYPFLCFLSCQFSK